MSDVHRIRIRAGTRDESGDMDGSNDPRISWAVNDGSSNQVQQWLTGVDFRISLILGACLFWWRQVKG